MGNIELQGWEYFNSLKKDRQELVKETMEVIHRPIEDLNLFYYALSLNYQTRGICGKRPLQIHVSPQENKAI